MNTDVLLLIAVQVGRYMYIIIRWYIMQATSASVAGFCFNALLLL